MHTSGVKRLVPVCFQGAALPPQVSAVAGAGSVAMTSGGFAKITSAAGNRSALTFGDVLSLPLANLDTIEFLVRPTALWPNGVSAAIGLGVAYNNDPSLIVLSLLATISSDGAVHTLVVSTDDGAGNTADSSGQTIELPAVGEWVRIRMALNDHSVAVGHPKDLNNPSRASDISVHVTSKWGGGVKDQTVMHRFDLSQHNPATNPNVQPIIQLGGGVAELDVWEFCYGLSSPR